jgi:hypothetical protein
MPENRVDKRQPDVYFEIGKRKFVIDVAFCKDGAREKRAFDEKIKKYSILGADNKPLYDPDNIIPIIISYRGYIHGRSRRLLERYIPELDIV